MEVKVMLQLGPSLSLQGWYCHSVSLETERNYTQTGRYLIKFPGSLMQHCGWEERTDVAHFMPWVGTILTKPPTGRAELPPQDQETAIALEHFSIESRMGWNREKFFMFPEKKQAVNLWQVFFCLAKIALHYVFREGEMYLSLCLCGFGLGRAC